MGLVAPRSVGALSFCSPTGDFVPLELLCERRAGAGRAGAAAVPPLAPVLGSGRAGAGEAGSALVAQVEKVWEVSVRLVPAEARPGLWSCASSCPQAVLAACSCTGLFWSQEWLGVEGSTKRTSLHPLAMGRSLGFPLPWPSMGMLEGWDGREVEGVPLLWLEPPRELCCPGIAARGTFPSLCKL